MELGVTSLRFSSKKTMGAIERFDGAMADRRAPQAIAQAAWTPPHFIPGTTASPRRREEVTRAAGERVSDVREDGDRLEENAAESDAGEPGPGGEPVDVRARRRRRR